MRASRRLLAGLAAAACAGTFRGIAHAAPAGTSVQAEVGQKAPTFQLADQNGKLFRLRDHLGRQPILLVFYRGYW